MSKCPKCGTDLLKAPGIGPYCPNKKCDVVDNIYGKIEINTMRSKITLTYEDTGPKNVHGFESVDHRIVHEIDTSGGKDWNSLMQSFINFLRGIGYVIPDDEDRV